jgi:hypothetical protein
MSVCLAHTTIHSWRSFYTYHQQLQSDFKRDEPRRNHHSAGELGTQACRGMLWPKMLLYFVFRDLKHVRFVGKVGNLPAALLRYWSIAHRFASPREAVLVRGDE